MLLIEIVDILLIDIVHILLIEKVDILCMREGVQTINVSQKTFMPLFYISWDFLQS